MASLLSSIHSCNLKSLFLGERKEICITNGPISRIGFPRKPVQCKESRIGKRPIEVPPNVTIALDGQYLKVKGPLGELSRTYPREVKIESLESGTLRVLKALDTRRANQMHGLFR
ncbi:putative 50S ribosomal protein L6, chloroplastic [Cocos nucifera]|uniref:Putative 50S ribosomal protein L6, chloroplastic n=1 Tax=Cocos nucifera TaxID=13894 RepID=A0A8K0N0D3_COCNU|nr:putative 50S ribosomal protein L6, chloroplastic [Cocos nucifera]